MKVVTCEIAWHNKEPVYSLDFQHGSDGRAHRLATAGVDTTVRLWRVDAGPDGKAVVEFLSNLARHTKAVNVVRFSPNGELLASGGDDAAILLWKLNDSKEPEAPAYQDEEDAQLNKESWSVLKILRGHLEDVYDICWTRDGNFMVSGSVDNTAVMWDVHKGQKLCILNDHKSYVQGVTWDPLGQYIATLSCDRVMRVYSAQTKKKTFCVSKMSSGSLAEGECKQHRMFHDDSMRSFFRRLSFTPDGSFLLAPAGCVEIGENVINTTYIFSRKGLKRPIAHLPCPSKATLAVRCCPVYFELRKKGDGKDMRSFLKDEEPSVSTLPDKFQLPYRMVFAVASEDSIFLYDTQQTLPFGLVSNVHYHTLSDLTWSRDGSFLAVSSTDGYCSFLSFSPGELGTLLKEPPTLEVFAPNSGVEKKGKKPPRTSSPGTQQPNSATSPASQKDSPCVSPPEERKSTPRTKSKPQPRRITLNTLEGWGKPSASKTTAAPSPQTPTPACPSAPSTPPQHGAPRTPSSSPFTPKVLNGANSAGPATPKGTSTPKAPTPSHCDYKMAESCTDTTSFYSWSDGDAHAAGGTRPAVTSGGGGAPPARRAPNFELIDGLLYRKKLERGYLNYREVLGEDRRRGAVSSFHRRGRPGRRHLSLEETYRCVAENYWWEGMYFQIRDFVLGCPDCRNQHTQNSEKLGGRGCVTKTMASHNDDVLSKLRGQREAGMFCDVTLHTDGRPYFAHRAVLAAVSDHFQEVFTEMDSGTKADVDLTGFSEDSLLSLLDFSYSSTLRVRQEDLPEVMAMARHLGMWLAVEACGALMKEQRLHHGPRDRRGTSGLRDPDRCFRLALDSSNGPRGASPKRGLRRTARTHGCSCLSLSPSHRMKLMDFKSPSSKKVAAETRGYAGMSPPNTGLLAAEPRGYAGMSPPNTGLLAAETRGYAGMSPPNARLLAAEPRSYAGMSPPNAGLLAAETRSYAGMSPPNTGLLAAETRSYAGMSPPNARLLAAETRGYAGMSPPNARLLRSSPGAAQEVQRSCSTLETPRPMRKPRPAARLSRSPVRVKQEVDEVGEDERDYTRAQEKYELMNVLGLQRTALLPRPEDLIGWRQKKRLRKLKANDYSLTKRRRPPSAPPGLPIGPVTLSLPLCSAVTTRFLSGSAKATPSTTGKRRRAVPQRVPPSDRSLRSKVLLPDMFAPSYRGRQLRQSVRQSERPNRISQQPLQRRGANKPRVRNAAVGMKAEPVEFPVSGQTPHRTRTSPRTRDKNKVPVDAVKTPRYNSSRPAKAKPRRGSGREGGRHRGGAPDTRPRVQVGAADGFPFSQQEAPPSICNHPLYKVIKAEPADPVPVDPVPVAAFSDPPSPDRGKRQSKPPIKLLDPGFLFSFCRPAGGPMAALKKEEESVDICLTRSVSEMSPHRALRARGAPALPAVKREERSASRRKARSPRPKSGDDAVAPMRPAGPKARRAAPKREKLPQRVTDATRRARLKQLRGPCSQAPTAQKASHACLRCPAFYNDCDALIMHRLRHVQGKHWPCPLCSKTFFRLRNVRSHIRTHDPKLYKCRSCIVAGS
ncbi:chromatin assembly factor 1 subunit B [Brachionichthys hirsutus]|uniref:chromatin assembly factor 1 subunit B n=1 Tax=Brachionichthys hirsutus TaxID=412623 RepID=UPI0036051A7E